jgi:hypothetical protein
VDPSAQTKPLLVCVTATAAVSAASSFRPIQVSAVISLKASASCVESANLPISAPFAVQAVTASSRMTASVDTYMQILLSEDRVKSASEHE